MLADVGPATADWLARLPGFEPLRERGIETLLTVGNGLTGTRGSLEEGTRASMPGTFLAGVFDPARETVEPPGHPGESPGLVTAPDWLRVLVDVDGRRLSVDDETVEHERVLHLRESVVRRTWRHRDASGRITRIVTLRCASAAEPHTLLQRVSIVPENYGGRVRLRAVLDGSNASGLTLEPFVADWVTGLEGRTATGVRVAMAQASELTAEDAGALTGHDVDRESVAVTERWEWDAEPGRRYDLDRVVAIFTSRESREPRAEAARHASRRSAAGTTQALDDHRRWWAQRWRDADVQVRGDDRIARALRIGLYHLLSAASADDEHVSIGARALTGGAYRGHVFWETEIYVLPFFVFTWPAAARALLMYRYHTLAAARVKASRSGFRGALYAWESAGSGHEVTPSVVPGPDGRTMEEIVTGTLGHHISADIAYAVRQYWVVTGDDAFFAAAGAEIALETARFWASRARREDDRRFHVRGVVGPDEYHETVDDSAYTNGMAAFNLGFGIEAAAWLRAHAPERWRELAPRLGLSEDELDDWRTVAMALVTGHDPSTRLIEQFAGYLGLEDIDLGALEPRTAAIDVLLGRERTRKTQVVKQADVVLLCHLLADRLDDKTVAACFDYYEPRCDHASSLSPSIHALVAARLGRADVAERYLDRAAAIDLDDSMGNAALGFHAGNAGGLWQAVVFGVAGVAVRDDGLAFDPRPLPGWESLSFPLTWRGRRAEVTVAPDRLDVQLTDGPGAMRVHVGSHEPASLHPGQHQHRTWFLR